MPPVFTGVRYDGVMPAGKSDSAGPLGRAVSAEIRALLARQRLSASEVAKRTGISQNYISKRLRDEAPFTLNDLERIAPVFGLTDMGILVRAAKSMEEGLNNGAQS